MKSFQHVALWWHVWWMKPTLATITSPPPFQTRFVGRQICTSYSVDKRSNFTYQSAPRTYCVNTATTVPHGNDVLHTCILWLLKCVTETIRCETSHKYTKYTAFLQCKILWTFHKTVQEDCLTLKDGTDRLSCVTSQKSDVLTPRWRPDSTRGQPSAVRNLSHFRRPSCKSPAP